MIHVSEHQTISFLRSTGFVHPYLPLLWRSALEHHPAPDPGWGTSTTPGSNLCLPTTCNEVLAGTYDRGNRKFCNLGVNNSKSVNKPRTALIFFDFSTGVSREDIAQCLLVFRRRFRIDN